MAKETEPDYLTQLAEDFEPDLSAENDKETVQTLRKMLVLSDPTVHHRWISVYQGLALMYPDRDILGGITARYFDRRLPVYFEEIKVHSWNKDE